MAMCRLSSSPPTASHADRRISVPGCETMHSCAIQRSLKARSCVAGRALLYEYCASHGVPHRRCGKLIVATEEKQLSFLEEIGQRARANGVGDLEWFSKETALQLEPELSCVAALHSPSTGIIDSHALMLAYLGDAEAHGAMLALRSIFEKAVVNDGFTLHVAGSDPVHARILINSAGLKAPTVARKIEGYPAEKAPREFFAKGSYFSLGRRSPFSRLIYPVPEPGGLGVHLTLDLAGQARFGPDVEWVQSIAYDVDPQRGESFYAAIRRYWPGLPDGALRPAYSGIRPKTAGPGEPAPDFEIQGPAVHGIPGLVHLFGIESPGLTASLALAGLVLKEVG